MKTKLSKLQKSILIMADENQRLRLHNRDVLANFYGWQPTTKWPGARTIRFTRDEVGKGYNARHVAVVKSFNRLETRGLIKYHKGSGVNITPKGKQVTRTLKKI